MSKVFGLATVVVGLVGLAVADDAKPQDWSKFTVTNTFQGEVKVASETGLTITVSKTVTPTSLRGRPTVKKEDFKLVYAEGGLARWKNPPPKLDDKGKKLSYTEDEMKVLKLPPGAPGYAAERTAVVAGQYVEVTMVLPKDVKADKAVFQDYLVKQVLIVGMNPAMEKMDKKQ